MKIKMQFRAKKQEIDLTESFEDEDQKALDRLMAAQEEFDEAETQFLSRMSFYWHWWNSVMKIEANEVFVDLSDFTHAMDPSNSRIDVWECDGDWFMNAWTAFEVEIKEGWTAEKFELWLGETDLYYCGEFSPWASGGDYSLNVLDD
jgi:hypothetical protein